MDIKVRLSAAENKTAPNSDILTQNSDPPSLSPSNLEIPSSSFTERRITVQDSSLNPSNPLSKLRYKCSDLAFSSPTTGVTFYDPIEYRYGQPTPRYTSAVIFSKNPLIGNFSLKAFKENKSIVYYHSFEEEEKYEGLENLFSTLAANYSKPSPILPDPKLCLSTTLERVHQDLMEADTVFITFGAGLSAGYIPTLIEFFTFLKLQKIPSTDLATDESMYRFVNKLVNKKDKIFEKIRTNWSKVYNHTLLTTPTHTALAEIIRFLQDKGKKVFVYTDNIDGIHKRVGISLSEKYIPEESCSNIIYPSVEECIGCKATVLVCGQSFDFYQVLGTLNTRKPLMERLNFYALNIDPTSIIVYQGIDMSLLSENVDIDLEALSLESLDMAWVEGNLHDTMPRLYRLLKGTE